MLALQEEGERLRTQLTDLASELASLRERIGRSFHTCSKAACPASPAACGIRAALSGNLWNRTGLPITVAG